MTDWLGMAASPRSPHPELKVRVLARALERRRWMWALAAAALLVVLAGGGGAYWASRTIRGFGAGRGTLAARAAPREGNLKTLLHRAATPRPSGPGAARGPPAAVSR